MKLNLLIKLCKLILFILYIIQFINCLESINKSTQIDLFINYSDYVTSSSNKINLSLNNSNIDTPLSINNSNELINHSNSKLFKNNCDFFIFNNYIQFFDLNISSNEFQQIVNLKSNDVIYFGKKIVYENSNLIVTCLRRSNQIEWYLNINSIDELYLNRNLFKTKKQIKPYEIQQYFCSNFNLTIHRLIIRKAEFINTGDYQCIDKNIDNNFLNDNHKKINHINNKFFIQILIINWEFFNGKFLNSINYDILNRNQSLTKYCPLSSFSWFKWSTNLNLNNQSILIINESGRYFCRSESLNRQMDFYIFESPSIIYFNVSGNPEINGQLKFECRANSFPLAEFIWFRGKSKIDINREKFSKYEFSNSFNYPNSILTITNLSKDDEDLYTCKARNLIEDHIFESEIEEFINITEIKKHRLNLKGVTDLECPNVASVDNWYYKNKKIDIEQDKKFKLKNNNKTLMIVNPDVDLEGEYKCEFKSKNHTLILITPPRIHLAEVENCRIDLKSVHAYLGKNFRIDCKSNNQNIKYSMRWLKNGEEIRNEVTNTLSLEFNNLKESAKANYTCQASNEVGHFNIEFYLRVRSSSAYLWPISGIIAEIIILLSVIWWSERNKNQGATDD